MTFLHMTRLRLEITVMAIICQTRLSLESSREPPKVRSSDRVVEHRVRVGDSVRLSCSVDSDSPLIVDWEKDGRPIHVGRGLTEQRRFRLSRQDNGLRISNVTSDDRGRYVCRATNGFGRTEIEHRVEIAWSYGLQKSGDRKTTFLTLSVGDSLLLPCSNESHLADVTWYKDGVALSSFFIGEENRPVVNSSLTLNDVTSDASGVYECHNGNDGDVAIYVIDVIKAHKSPVFARRPENASATLNGRATFFCQMNSELPLRMQWLKRVEAVDGSDDPATGAVVIGDWWFMSVNRTEFLQLDGSSYFSKLQIRNVRHRDVGFYVCVGTNTYGYVTGGAYLTLIQQEQDILYYEDDIVKNTNRDASEDSPFLSLIVVIVVLSLLVFFSLLSFVIYRTRFGRKSTAGGTAPSTRSSSSSSSSSHSAVERRVTSSSIDGIRRPTSGGLLATPELDRRAGQRHLASALNLDEGDSCFDAPSSNRDPYQPRIPMREGGRSPRQSDPWRKTQHHMMAEMTSLRLFGRRPDTHNSVTELPTPHCHHHHHHDKFRFERDDES